MPVTLWFFSGHMAEDLILSYSHGINHLANCELVYIFQGYFACMKAAVRGADTKSHKAAGALKWSGGPGRTSNSSHELNSQEVYGVRVGSLEIKMSEVIAFKMPSPDENHQFHLTAGRLNLLLTAAHSPYECPSDATQGSSTKSPLMVKINGFKLSNSFIYSFFCSEGRTAPSHNLPVTDLSMATEVNE